MWDKSIDMLQKHLSLKTATWKDERCASMRYISRCYLQKKDVESARSWLYKAIAEAPYLREPYVELALLEYEQNNSIATLHMCLEALKIQSKSASYINENFAWDSTIYDLCSIGYYQLGLLSKSLEYSNKALEISPNDERLKNNNIFFKDTIDAQNKQKEN
jgi:tetratricopeptide (TPR) repeat protein